MSLVFVRLKEYKSFRHYGGREITVKLTKVLAEYIKEQSDHTFLVRLCEGGCGYKAGHLIAIQPKDFNI